MRFSRLHEDLPVPGAELKPDTDRQVERNHAGEQDDDITILLVTTHSK
jgi:hypothetical protein